MKISAEPVKEVTGVTLTLDLETARALRAVVGLGTAHWSSMRFTPLGFPDEYTLINALHPVSTALAKAGVVG